MPFQFTVGGIELLGLPGRQPAKSALPLLGFPTDLYRVVASMRPGEAMKCYLAGGGELTFERMTHLMRLSSSLTGETVTVNADELLKSAQTLLERVRDALLKRFPDMQSHPAWGSWFSI